MSASDRWAAHTGWLASHPRPKRKRQSGTYELVEFLRPGGWWPSPYSLEQAFGVLQAMVRTAQDYGVDGRWGRAQVIDMMSNTLGGIGRSQMDPIRSLEDLKRRFHYALLSRDNGAAQKWRQDHGFTPESTVTLDFPHWKPFAGTPHPEFASESDIAAALAAMLSPTPGTRLIACPNAIHLKAREVCGVAIHVLPERFVFRLDYGYDGSSWSYRLAHTRKGESFLDTAVRAWRAFELLTQGPRQDLAHWLNLLVEPAYEDDRPFWIDCGSAVVIASELCRSESLVLAHSLGGPRRRGGGYAIAQADGILIGWIRGFDIAHGEALLTKVAGLGDWDAPTLAMTLAARRVLRTKARRPAPTLLPA